MERILASNPDMPPEARDCVAAVRQAAPALRLRSAWSSSVVIDVVFGLLGGLLGVALFKKNTPPPPGTVEVLPPA